MPPGAAVVDAAVADAAVPAAADGAPPLGDADKDAGPAPFPVVEVTVDATPADVPPAADDDVDDIGCGGRKACGGIDGGLICVSTTGGRAA